MDEPFKINEPQDFILAFHDNEGDIVGKLIIKDKKLVFEGDAHPSAQIFVQFIIKEFELWESRRGG